MEAYAHKRLKKILLTAYSFPTLRKQVSGGAKIWTADLLWVKTRPKMAAINQKARKKNQATDVLSFPTPIFFQQHGILGELVVCLPVLTAQALEQGHSLRTELDILLVHGVLHLLGYDHERNSKDALMMSRWEKKLLQSLGFSEKKLAHALISRNL